MKLGKTFELRAIVDSDFHVGVDHGEELIEFARAVLGNRREALDVARSGLKASMGAAAVTAAALTAGGFSLVDRAANGIGIWIEPMVLKPSAEFRQLMGLNDFPSARNTLQRQGGMDV